MPNRTAQETAKKANPNYGISVSPADLASKVTKAKGIPSAAATYKQKHLNLLVNASNPCLSVDGWRKGQSDWTLQEMEHESCLLNARCLVGSYLASTTYYARCRSCSRPRRGVRRGASGSTCGRRRTH